MTTAKTFIRKCLLAIALAGTALGAIAGPTSFHVDINTTTLSGAGLISLSFSKLGLAGPVTAQVSNFMGPISTVTGTGSAATAGGYSIANGPGTDNFLDFEALFGGTFSFDIAFTGNFMDETGLDTSSLFVSLLDFGYNSLAGDPLFGVASFTVQPGVGIVAKADFPAFAAINANATAVPEPSSMLMMMTGLGLVGFTARRRKPQATAAATA